MKENREIACRRCGACCHVDMIAYVTSEDIRRWEEERRYDIIARLQENRVMWAGDRIINSSGARVTSCSYLKWDGSPFSCEIYETRPVVCRNFVPGASQACPLWRSEKLFFKAR